MPYARRLVRPVLLAALVLTLLSPLTGGAIHAQDNDDGQPVTIQGTPELETLVAAIRDAYVEQYPDAEVEIDPRGGQRTAFEALCNGEVDLVMSTEPIDDSQIQACGRNEQNFIELVLAYQAVVFLAPPETDATCVDPAILLDSWQLGAPEEVSWAELGSPETEAPVSFYGPEDLSAAYLLLGDLVPAGELREDIVTTSEVANILDKVREEGEYAMGFMSLADFEALEQPEGEDYLFPLEIVDAEGRCIPPAINTLEDGSYPLMRTSYLYVNAASAEREDVRSFLQFALAEEDGAQAIVPAEGFTAPLAATYEYGLNNLLTGEVGRTFTRPVTPVNVPITEAGTISVVGSAMLGDVLSPIRTGFRRNFSAATIQTESLGNTAGWADFCTGDADVLMATRPASEDEEALCEENGIDPYVVDLGYQALVVAVPTGNDWIECVTGDLVLDLLGRGTEDDPAPTLWSDLDADWPESEILLVVPPPNTGALDYLVFTLANELTFAPREDVTESDDPLYRAQGVANTDNGLTYLWWGDFQASDADVKALGAGEDCVVTGLDTFADGSYPLSYPARIYFSRASFDNGLVRAFLWHFFDEDSLDAFADTGFAGLDIEAMAGPQRDDLFEMLAEVEGQLAAEDEAEAEEEDAEADEPAEDEAEAENTEAEADDESDDAAADEEAAPDDDADSEADEDAAEAEEAE